MKPYLFLSGLLLGTSISMSSLADTHVVDGSCNDARYGACTSDQTSLTTYEIMLDVENKEDYHTNDFSICDLRPNALGGLEWAGPFALVVVIPVLAGAIYCKMR